MYRNDDHRDSLHKYAATGSQRGGWYSNFSMEDVREGRCPCRLQPGDVGFRLPRATGKPFARRTVVKRARVVSHTEPVPVTIYVPTSGGQPPKKVRKLEIETASLCEPVHVIVIAHCTSLVTTPTGVATLPTPVEYVFEDYFVVEVSTTVEALQDTELVVAKGFVAVVTARLEGRG